MRKKEINKFHRINKRLYNLIHTLKETPTAIYVDLHSEKRKNSVIPGLRLAYMLSEDRPDRKIIIHGFDHIQELWINPYFKRVMAHKNTLYMKAPFYLKDLPRKYSEKKFENLALRAIAEVELKKENLKKLIQNSQNGVKARKNAIGIARKKLKLSGSDSEIINKLFTYKHHSTLTPQFFPGVFCDLEGTLFLTDGSMNQEVLKNLKDYSAEKPVCMWTGSNLKEMSEFLKIKNIEYPLLDKNCFKECKVEIAIDDLDQKQFEEIYNVMSNEYVKI